ncbi:LysE family transporter [Tropicimonas sp. IMCC34043]|uniref:LysE family transporter n=1 Tax=Tropicimonas sp. IMCC34043 TaxID=2248760 RepID=UPI0018E57C17|nr:LysE family transporter [Tropicimonas sp. IMCC34043]
MIEVLVKGIGAGLAVAAPVGPIGLLCIRRTALQGRATGLATGLGAATADAVYGLIAAAGFAASGLLVTHAGIMALGGGLLLAMLGALSLKRFLQGQGAVSGDAAVAEATSAGAGAPSVSGVPAAYATGVALTLSNPATILTFVGMIAALGATARGSVAAPYWLVLGVFLGSALWWLILVHGTLLVRGWMTGRALRWLDLVSGLLLLIWGGWIALAQGLTW